MPRRCALRSAQLAGVGLGEGRFRGTRSHCAGDPSVMAGKFAMTSKACSPSAYRPSEYRGCPGEARLRDQGIEISPRWSTSQGWDEPIDRRFSIFRVVLLDGSDHKHVNGERLIRCGHAQDDVTSQGLLLWHPHELGASNSSPHNLERQAWRKASAVRIDSAGTSISTATSPFSSCNSNV